MKMGSKINSVINKYKNQQFQKYEVASLRYRLVSFIVDYTITAAFAYFISRLARIIFQQQIISVLISLILSIIFTFLYFQLDSLGGTIGKRLLRLKVINSDESSLVGFGRNILRTSYKFIPFSPILSLITIVTRKDKKAIHGILANTTVIRT